MDEPKPVFHCGHDSLAESLQRPLSYALSVPALRVHRFASPRLKAVRGVHKDPCLPTPQRPPPPHTRPGPPLAAPPGRKGPQGTIAKIPWSINHFISSAQFTGPAAARPLFSRPPGQGDDARSVYTVTEAHRPIYESKHPSSGRTCRGSGCFLTALVG